MDCPDDEELAALVTHAVAAERRAAIIDHAAGCASCHAVVAELASAGAASRPPALDATRSSDDVGGEVRRAVASALIAHDRRNRLGRYHLLEIVGAGGMGVVWGAWDPELARRVALKLVHPRLGAARERILVEGQALARLSHPNVVPVYDVGVIDDRVYLVMEWVQGTTLRAYAASGCTRRALIDAYRQAGEGVAAAHRAGLVHRDFKPDNAIRGDDGRVRVLDFGLARSDVAEPVRKLAGTPRYMPPEQAAGGVVTAASDQFAFARSLHEALGRHAAASERPPRDAARERPPRDAASERPPRDAEDAPALPKLAELPSWLAQIVERGTAAAPADRFPSMDALLHALARDPARIWRRRGIAAAALVTAVAAFAVGAHSSAPPTCTGSAAEIARSWSPAARARVLGHLPQLGSFGASEATRLGGELDAYSAAWADAHHRACVAHARGELPATLYERRIACLARGQASLTAVAELMADVRADGLAAALVAARALPSAAGCTAADASSVPPPPDAVAGRVAALAPGVERARVLAVAARADAVAIARASVAAADSLGYAPLTARALLAQGRAETELDVAAPAAKSSFERALALALRSGDDVLAVESYARLIYAVARYQGDVVDSWPVMEAVAARTGAPGRFGRALLYNNKAVARIAAGDRPAARGLLLQALAAAPPPARASLLSDGELELAAIPQNLALASDDASEREQRSRQAAAELAALLGPNHPNTLGARLFAAILTRNPALAAADLAAACEGYQRWHPQLAAVIAECAFERAWLADERGDLVLARAQMLLAANDPLSPHERGKGTIAAAFVRLAGPTAATSPTRATPATRDASAGATAATRDKSPDARAAAVRDLEALGGVLAHADNWWSRGEAADAYLIAARGHDQLGRAAEAERCLRRALALLEDVQQPMYERRLARVRTILALRLAARQPTAAAPLARAAVTWYRAAGGYEEAVAALAPIAR